MNEYERAQYERDVAEWKEWKDLQRRKASRRRRMADSFSERMGSSMLFVWTFFTLISVIFMALVVGLVKAVIFIFGG